jgi:peptide/nickel transport system ATP-binding protein
MVDASLRATILGSLLKLNQEFGISLIYITHDLTTAYQVSEDLIVLYRGGVAEAGDVDLVVKEPEHPYTRLLVGSIPLPDPSQSWQGERILGRPAGELGERGEAYCSFTDRCPFAMSMCVQQVPPLFRTDPHRVTSCFLYRDAPITPGDKMATVFKGYATEAEGGQEQRMEAVVSQDDAASLGAD